MTSDTFTDQTSAGKLTPGTPAISMSRLVLKVVLLYSLIAAALFISAGRLDWIAGWTYLCLHAGFSVGLMLWLARNDAGLLKERATAEGTEVRRVEKVILSGVRIFTLALYVTAGLDAGRFAWSSVPVGLRALGWVMGLFAGILILWVMRTNTFASVVVRLQSDRGHHVIQDGPYRIVRHPMYLGNLSLFLGLPLMLGSWWAYIPAVLMALTFIYRTMQEDRFLRKNLDGYAEFSTRTRFRLIPGVW